MRWNQSSKFEVTNGRREEHDPRCISLGPEWTRSYYAGSPSCELPTRISYGNEGKSLRFFTLTKPGQLLSARYEDIASLGPHVLDASELADLFPLLGLTTERRPSLTSAHVSTIARRVVVIFTSQWSWRPCGQAYMGLKPGEKIHTHFRVETVLMMDDSAIRFEGIEFTTPAEFFDTNIPAFHDLLMGVDWEMGHPQERL